MSKTKKFGLVLDAVIALHLTLANAIATFVVVGLAQNAVLEAIIMIMSVVCLFVTIQRFIYGRLTVYEHE